MPLLHSKFVQSIGAFLVSFIATLVDLGSQTINDYQRLLEIGQVITVYGGIIIGLIRFIYWWKDRKYAIAARKRGPVANEVNIENLEKQKSSK